MGFLARAKEQFLKDTEKERAGIKQGVNTLKEKVREYKEKREYEKRPEVVRQRLEEERAEYKARLSTERDKQELRELKRKNSFVGRAVDNTRQYLKSVKTQKGATLGAGRNVVTPRNQYNMFGLGNQRFNQSVAAQPPGMLRTGGVFAGNTRTTPRKKQKKQSKTIVIKL